jgi:NAD-dependent SIR2 family protein deacetylase
MLIFKCCSLTRECDPSRAHPTLSHMALRELYARSFVRHILSQNCDGLHLRSGVPQTALSEIHGNMYIEVCRRCQPHRQHIRSFDVTEHTRYRQHKTARQCDTCSAPLFDTIVHFGENGTLPWPLNWPGVSARARPPTHPSDVGTLDVVEEECCELILVLGSSLKILSKYQDLWPTPAQKHRRRLVIVNLQPTCKDRLAKLKINARCDDVMQRVMNILNVPVPAYCALVNVIIVTFDGVSCLRTKPVNTCSTVCRRCDPINNVDNRRQTQLVTRVHSKITGCTCSSAEIAAASSPSTSQISLEDTRHGQTGANSLSTGRKPGWWAAGFAMVASGKKRKRPIRVTPKTATTGQPASKLENNVVPCRRRGRPARTRTQQELDSAADLLLHPPIKRRRGRPTRSIHNSCDTPPVKSSSESQFEYDVSQCLSSILDRVCAV